MVRKAILGVIGVCFLALSVGAAVTFEVAFDVLTNVGGPAYCNTYNPGDDTFLSVPLGQQIVALSGADGSLTGLSYNMTGVDLTGLGVFGLGAGPDGVVYGFSSNSLILHRWASPAAEPTTAATGVQFTRNMTVHGSGIQTIVTTTGEDDFGRIDIYGTTDRLHFSLIDSVTGIAKNGHTIAPDLSMAWGTPAQPLPIAKKRRVAGEWIPASRWSPDPVSDGAGPLWYDPINGLLLGTTPRTDIAWALDAYTGELLGSVPLTDDGYEIPSFNGAYGTSYPGGGTFWFAQRGPDNTAHVGKLTYSLPTRRPAALYLLDGFGKVQVLTGQPEP